MTPKLSLYAPASYVAAPTEVRLAVVNGCGPGGWKVDLIPDRIWGLDISEACNIHDWMYSAGATLAEKDEADRVFLNNCLRLIANGCGPGWLQALRRRRARTYYEAVSHYGGPAYWAGKNPAETILQSPLQEAFNGN